ncbi:chaperone protein DnaJ [Geobacter sp. OR-1]|uniref:J domain-containing protein n=1 Tax=Geobacter sp. OR-1 TaxID=1266765 RepID=UPI00054210D8|nr:J domain-containing protein [Geobacter sp. OR-1]GAM09528.1 chaperone protein DnaJ [Geobacter sp. OR-1]
MSSNKSVKWAYAVLGLSYGASETDVRKAYRELVMLWHPDHFQQDPHRQNAALEKLKNLNEAYDLIRTEIELQRGSVPHVDSGSIEPTAHSEGFRGAGAPERGEGNVSGTPVERLPGLEAVKFLDLLRSWQNIAFAAFVVILLRLSLDRFGSVLVGAGYLLEILALPLIFAIVCNVTRLGRNRGVWSAYVVSIGIATAVVFIDAVNYRNELHEASVYNGSRPADVVPGAGSYGGKLPDNPPGDPFFAGKSKSPGGPVPPQSPYVQAPLAPVVPDAPAVPAAPIAPPAK